MSLASLSLWFSTLVGVVRFVDKVSVVTEIPMTVAVTALICLCILLQVRCLEIRGDKADFPSSLNINRES